MIQTQQICHSLVVTVATHSDLSCYKEVLELSFSASAHATPACISRVCIVTAHPSERELHPKICVLRANVRNNEYVFAHVRAVFLYNWVKIRVYFGREMPTH